jgi:hypothetical protein
MIQEFLLEAGVTLSGLAQVRSPVFLVAMVTSAGVKVIQVKLPVVWKGVNAFDKVVLKLKFSFCWCLHDCTEP